MDAAAVITGRVAGERAVGDRQCAAIVIDAAAVGREAVLQGSLVDGEIAGRTDIEETHTVAAIDGRRPPPQSCW